MNNFNETKFYKWIDNFWYHYKWIVLIVALFATIIIVSTVQIFTREVGDIYVLYAGPKVVSLQESLYIEKTFEKIDEIDHNGDGEINAIVRTLTIMSPEDISESNDAHEEEVGAANEGYIINEQMLGAQMSGAMQTFNQEIFGGDSVICLLSPYTYKIVHDSNGFLPLADVLGYTPEGAYDECAVYLKDTDFGSLEGLSSLGDDTLFCIRRMSTMSFMKGHKKTEALYNYQLDKFKTALTYTKAE
ncbi:MAG: hypothetical protein E7635_02450 [Ruminococcaceae bacterium]|nr:hypothetical protein [Oscillospiraceae bacterium]